MVLLQNELFVAHHILEQVRKILDLEIQLGIVPAIVQQLAYLAFELLGVVHHTFLLEVDKFLKVALILVSGPGSSRRQLFHLLLKRIYLLFISRLHALLRLL